MAIWVVCTCFLEMFQLKANIGLIFKRLPSLEIGRVTWFPKRIKDSGFSIVFLNPGQTVLVLKMFRIHR